MKFRNSGHNDNVLFIRENCFGHWQILHQLGRERRDLQRWLEPHGVVLGDPHLRNIENRLFGYFRKGSGLVKVAFNDADDTGQGPLFGDLLRLMSASAAEKIDIAKLPKKYLQGLIGKKLAPPWVVERFLRLKPEQFLSLQQKLFKKEIARIQQGLKNHGLFNFNGGAGHIEVMNNPALQIHLQNLLGLPLIHKKNIPKAFYYIKKGGGSGGDTRYWLLAKNFERLEFIYEFKPLSKIPGVAAYQTFQRNPLGRYQLAFARMYGDLRFLTPLQLMTINKVPFLLRAKFSNPLKSWLDKNMGAHDKKRFAEYAAYMLGQFHRRSPTDEGHQFAKMIEKDVKDFSRIAQATTESINSIMNSGLKKSIKALRL